MNLLGLLAFSCALGVIRSDTVVVNQLDDDSFVGDLTQANSVVLNKLVDELLTSVNEIITKAGKQYVAIPSVGTTWHKETWWYSITCSLLCENGQMGELNSLARTGDAVMTTNGSTIVLSAQLGLSACDFHFDICRAKCHLISVHGQVGGTCTSNSIGFQISMTFDPTHCSAKLDSIAVNSLGDVTINLGGGLFHEFEDKLVEMIIDHWDSDIKNAADKYLQTTVGQVVQKDSQKICNYIPHKSYNSYWIE